MTSPAPYSIPSTGNHIPEDRNQYLVQTPFGKGLVLRTRPPDEQGVRMREVELIDWQQAQQLTTSSTATTTTRMCRPTVLYTSNTFPSVEPLVGDEVMTMFGRGTVSEIRDNGNCICVVISSWRLAGRSRVKCYLSKSSVQVVRAKKLYEMTVFEKVEYAQLLKNAATQQFKEKSYQVALETYARAVEAVRYVQHKADSTNEVRADLLVLMITCSNNAGTCCTQLQKWDESYQFGRNASILIDALEEKKGLRIHTLLNEEGFTDVKMFGEWRVKSYLLMARGLTEKHESTEAIEILKKAHDVIVQFTGPSASDNESSSADVKASIKMLLANDKEVKRLHATCKEQRKAHLKKEKLRAQAMFASPSKNNVEKDVSSEEKKESSSNNSSPPRDANKGITAPVGSAVSDVATSRSPDASSNGAAAAPAAAVVNGMSSPAGKDSSNSKKKLKKRVSFAENVMSQEDQADKKGNADDDVSLLEDPEVLIGLALFGGTLLALGAGLTYLFTKRR